MSSKQAPALWGLLGIAVGGGAAYLVYRHKRRQRISELATSGARVAERFSPGAAAVLEDIAQNPREVESLLDELSRGYGHISHRHFRKLGPWIHRLHSASSGLKEDIQKGNPSEVLKSLEDVHFWRGRIVCDALSSSDQWKSDPRIAPHLFRAFQYADATADQAERFLLASTGRGYGDWTDEQLTVSRAAEREGLDNSPATDTHRRNLDRLRVFLRKIPFDIRINSAYRAPEVNEAVGGARHSQHMNALAFDATPRNMTNKELATWLYIHRRRFSELDQVIWYTGTSHVHVGICPPGAEDCHRDAPRGMFMVAQSESGGYESWEPTAEEIADVKSEFPERPGRSWAFLLYGGVLVLAGVLAAQVRARKKRERYVY